MISSSVESRHSLIAENPTTIRHRPLAETCGRVAKRGREGLWRETIIRNIRNKTRRQTKQLTNKTKLTNKKLTNKTQPIHVRNRPHKHTKQKYLQNKMMSTKNVKARNDMRYETASGGGIRHASSKGGLFVLLSVVCLFCRMCFCPWCC